MTAESQAQRDIDLLKEKRVIAPEKEIKLFEILTEMYKYYGEDNAKSGSFVKQTNDIIESCPIILE